jgi:hypothetical protein
MLRLDERFLRERAKWSLGEDEIHALSFRCAPDAIGPGDRRKVAVRMGRSRKNAATGAYSGYHLATVYAKIPMVECAIVDEKTAQPNWNSLKN